jgi:hypothetical protein
MQIVETGSTAVDDELWSLLWRVRLSNLYHQKRERFLDGVDRGAKAISALGAAAAFTQVRSATDLGLWITGFITVISTLSLVYGPSSKARRHAELARDFKRLEADIIAIGSSLSLPDLSKFEAKFLVLEASEPAALGALVTQCHNELAVAYGKPDEVTKLPWIQRCFKNWFDFDQSRNLPTPRN